MKPPGARFADRLPDCAWLADGIDRLAALTDSTVPGWTRQVFSEPYRASRELVESMMREAGLEVRRDGAGNVVGRLPGLDPALAPLMTGSHTDTVASGGRYDGMVGVLGAIEAARLIAQSGSRLRRDLYIVDFLGEEANDFGVSCFGSRAMAGTLTREHLHRDNGSGQRLGDALAAWGLDPGEAVSTGWKPGSLHGYVELHIEQGPELERAGAQIGVVTAIAGIERVLATLTGVADHAGTMPMRERHDALLAAAEGILAVERVGCGAPVHGVATTGRIESSPGALNIVPDHARIWVELRSIDPSWLRGARREVLDEIASAAARRGVESAFDLLNDQDPVPADPLVQDLVAAAAEELGYRKRPVPSGAGHDAAHIAGLGPMGMIFVPSAKGKSHCPEEYTAPEQIAAGVHCLVNTLVAMDGQVRVHRGGAAR